MNHIINEVSPSIDNDVLNQLFAESWDSHVARDFQPVLRHSLVYVCAFDQRHLIGFVNVAWDGGVHGFLLDTTVAPDYRRRKIGSELVCRAARVAAQRGLEWLHVDYEPHLDGFYRSCGFQKTEAGLLNLVAHAT